MRLDLAAGNDIFQGATGTGDQRKVVAEMAGPIEGPEVPSEKDCQKLLAEAGSRQAWVVNEDEDGAFATVKVQFKGFQAVWVAKIMHEGEKLRGAWKTKKLSEQEVRDKWSEFTLGYKLGATAKVVEVNKDDLEGLTTEEIVELLKAAGAKVS